ncbi:ferredoxin [Pseudokineococcus sp. 1T1Z-3]|uniref:ferredoxin n=1 Tax=Pseudokineococcus sp. 1T1Z-3 TaxID=3132745 RepID=UPI0030B232A5
MSARPDAASPAASLHVDWTACDGRGLCAELLPEVLAADPWGYPVAAGPHPESGGEPGVGGAPGVGPAPWPRREGVAVPAAALPDARRAVRMCPRLALRLEGAGGDRRA